MCNISILAYSTCKEPFDMATLPKRHSLPLQFTNIIPKIYIAVFLKRPNIRCNMSIFLAHEYFAKMKQRIHGMICQPKTTLGSAKYYFSNVICLQLHKSRIKSQFFSGSFVRNSLWKDTCPNWAMPKYFATTLRVAPRFLEGKKTLQKDHARHAWSSSFWTCFKMKREIVKRKRKSYCYIPEWCVDGGFRNLIDLPFTVSTGQGELSYFLRHP